MDDRRQNHGLRTFLEHWGLLVIPITAFLASLIFMFFSRLSGASWIWLFVAAMALSIFGACLIAYAKFPVYRSGRFFTFGASPIPDSLKKHYFRGWRIFLFGVALLICLLVSKP